MIRVTYTIPGIMSALTEDLDIPSDCDDAYIIATINKLIQLELNDDSIKVKQILSLVELPS